MTDIREEMRALNPVLHDQVRRLWPEDERRRYASDREAVARKHKPKPVTGDRDARAAVGGVAAVLLHHSVSGWLTRDLSHCWNEVRVDEPLDEAEVDTLLADASRRELARRKQGAAHA